MKKKVGFIVVNGILFVLYSLITIAIFQHYLALPSVEAQFNDCMWKLYGLSDNTGLGYEAINLLIYVVLFSLIVLFHLMEVLVIDGKIKKRNKTITTEK